MTSPDLTNVVWVKTILYSYTHIRPKKVKYPIPEIPDDSENKSGMDWVLPKIIGSGRVSGTRQALLREHLPWKINSQSLEDTQVGYILH